MDDNHHLEDLVDDAWLRARFRAPEVQDDGFSDRVISDIRQGQRRRTLWMSSVWAGGCLMALFSAGPLLADLPTYLPEYSSDWLTQIASHSSAIGMVVLACLSSAAVVLLED